MCQVFGAGRIQSHIVQRFFFTALISTEAYIDSHRADFKSSNNRPSQAEETKRNYTCQVSTKSCLGNDLQVHEEMTLHLTSTYYRKIHTYYVFPQNRENTPKWMVYNGKPY